MRITIEDLEALKELSDELEENHAETEKQLQEDLGLWWALSFSMTLTVVAWTDVKDTQIRDHLRKIETLEESCQDLDNTINQFREFVMQLQAYVFYLSVIAFVNDTYHYSYLSRTANLTNSVHKPRLPKLSRLRQHRKLLLWCPLISSYNPLPWRI